MSEIFTPQEPRQPLSDLNFDVDSFLEKQGMAGGLLDVQKLIDQKKESVMSVLTKDKRFLKDLKSAVKDGLDRDELMSLVDKALANPAIQEMFNNGATEADVRNMVADILNNPNLPKSGIEKMQGAFSMAMAIILVVTIIPISASNVSAGGNPRDIKPIDIKPSRVEQVAQRQISLEKYFTGEVPAGMVLNEADFEGSIGVSLESVKKALDFFKAQGHRFMVLDGKTVTVNLAREIKIDITSRWKQDIISLLLLHQYKATQKQAVNKVEVDFKEDAWAMLKGMECYPAKFPSLFIDAKGAMLYYLGWNVAKGFFLKKVSDTTVVLTNGGDRKVYFNNGVMSEVDPSVSERDREMQAKLAQMKVLLENMKPGKVGVKDKDVKSNLSTVHEILGRHLNALIKRDGDIDDEIFAKILQIGTALKRDIEDPNLSEKSVAELSKTMDLLAILSEGVF